LCDAKSDIEAKDENGYTPLITAIRGSTIETVKFLMSRGANKNATDNDGNDAIWHAKDCNLEEIAKYLESVEVGAAGGGGEATERPLDDENELGGGRRKRYGGRPKYDAFGRRINNPFRCGPPEGFASGLGGGAKRERGEDEGFLSQFVHPHKNSPWLNLALAVVSFGFMPGVVVNAY